MASAVFRMSINGGGYVTGGQTIALGATVQLKADSTVGWGSPPARYEIYGYPPGFACPAGWSVDGGDPAQVYYYLGNTDEPPSFTASVWGVYMLALHVNGGGAGLSYKDNALKILSPLGVHDIGRFERGQFSAIMGWLHALQQNFRLLDSLFGAVATLTASPPANVTKAAAAVGVATEAARADHKHDVATAAAVALTVGGANAEGSSSSLARADHTHALAAGTPAALTVGGSNTEGVATTAARSDHVHAISAGVPVSVGVANAAGAAATFARSDHVHALSPAAATAATGSTLLERDGFGGGFLSYISMGTNPALEGLVRAPNAEVIVTARNAANTDNLVVLATNASNEVLVGPDDGGNLGLRAKSAGFISFYIGNTTLPLLVDAAGISVASTGSASVANAGSVRLDNAGGMYARNTGDDGDVGLVAMEPATDNVVIGLSATKLGLFGNPSPGVNGGEGVVFIANATVVPAANPTGGGILYVEGGALKYRGSGGTVTPIAPA